MHLFLIILLFVIGIVLVVKGGDVFVDGASNIARDLNVPTFIIGATIVSIATTLPEMIVSLMAALKGSTDMAIGNAVGSVTANTALIMAVAMVSMSIVCKREKFLLQICMLIASATILWVSSFKGQLSILGSIVLAVIFLCFMVWNVRSAKAEISSVDEKKPVNSKDLIKNIFMFVIGAAAIVFGSRLMVNYGSELAKMIGVPERVISVTLIAVGTSLPELVTTVTAIIKKESGLSIGNIIGANIIDLSLILPLCSLFSGKPIPVSHSSIVFDIPASLVVTLLAMIPMVVKQKASRKQGIILLAVYAAYLVIVCAIPQ